MDIAALSIGTHQSQLQQAVQTNVLKKAMDGQEAQMQKLLEMLPQQPPTGYQVDVYA